MTQKETTTTETSNPKMVVNTTRQTVPEVIENHPQKEYEKKKMIFRMNRIVWYIVGVIEVLLVFRFVLKALGANSYSGFTSFVYTITEPLITPFRAILGTGISGNTVIEWSTIIAAVVYLVVAWGLVYFLDLINPVTPKEIEMTI